MGRAAHPWNNPLKAVVSHRIEESQPAAVWFVSLNLNSSGVEDLLEIILMLCLSFNQWQSELNLEAAPLCTSSLIFLTLSLIF